MRNAMLSCAFAGALLNHTAFVSQNAVAASSEAEQTKNEEAQPRLRARPEYKSGQEDRYRREGVRGGRSGRQGRDILLSAAARAVKGKEAPIPVIDEETLSLYPTAAQCGECHKQIYEEWSSSQHAYASISPMFHAFEQKFQELDPRYGRHLLRALPPAGRHPARRESRNAALGDEPDLARGRELHHLPPGQGAVRQGQRRAPGRAGQDLRPGLRQRRKERHQRHPRQQGHLLRQNQQGRAGHGHPQRHDDEPTAHQVGVLRQLPPGCRQPGHQAGDRVGSVSRQPGKQSRRHLPGLPHGQGPRKARGLCDRTLRRGRRQGNQPGTQACQSPLHRPGLFDRPPRHLPSQPEGPGLHHEGMAGVRLARRLGHQRLRRQGRARQGQGRLSQALGRWARP